MAGSRDDNPPNLLNGKRTVENWQWVIVAETPQPGGARVYIHHDCSMTNDEIADQLERISEYVRSQR